MAGSMPMCGPIVGGFYRMEKGKDRREPCDKGAARRKKEDGDVELWMTLKTHEDEETGRKSLWNGDYC